MYRWNFEGGSTTIPARIRLTTRRMPAERPAGACSRMVVKGRGKRACRGVDETYRHFDAGLLPQGRGLPVGVSSAYPSSRIYPVDRGGSLQRRLHGQLEIQRISPNPRPHLRPAERTTLPARARGERARRDLPPETGRSRLQG